MNRTLEILELVAKKVEEAEVFSIASEAVKVGFRAGKLVSSEVQEISGTSLRAIDKGKLGFYSTTDLTDTKRLLENVSNSVQYGGPANFQFAEPQNGSEFDAFSPETAKMDVQELVELGRKITERVATYGDDVVCNCNLTRTVTSTQLANSRNLSRQARRTSLAASLQVQRVRGDDVFLMWTGYNALRQDAGFEKLADKLVERLRQSERITQLSQCELKMPVVFAPPSLPLFVLPLAASLKGKNVTLGVSPLAGKQGEQLFDSRFSVIDDALLANRVNSTAYDHEGVPTQRRALIEHGKVAGFYYDLKSAGEANTVSTGNGLRQPETTHLGQVESQTHNFVIENGDTSFAEMINDIKEGLLVEVVLGMGQTNLLAGSFGNSVQIAYKIENGEIAGRVKDVSVAGNVYDLLREQLTAISRESELVGESLVVPYLRFDNVSVAAKS